MKRIGTLLLGLCLAACSIATPLLPASVPASPSVIADKTILDEKAAISVELAYQAWATAVEIAVDAGVLHGERAAQIKAIDNRIYGAVVAVREAYKAGNQTSYTNAVFGAKAAIEQGIAVMKGK